MTDNKHKPETNTHNRHKLCVIQSTRNTFKKAAGHSAELYCIQAIVPFSLRGQPERTRRTIVLNNDNNNNL